MSEQGFSLNAVSCTPNRGRGEVCCERFSYSLIGDVGIPHPDQGFDPGPAGDAGSPS